MNKLTIYIIIFILIFILVRSITRGFFWKDKAGNKLSVKQFGSRFKDGVQGVTPLQQTKTNLISLFPIIAGMLWGATVSFIGGTYWMCLILIFSLPLIIIQLISTLQRYWNLKKIAIELKRLGVKF